MSLANYSKTYKPLQYEWAEEYRKKSENMHWIPDEADLTRDVEDYKSASAEEKDFIKNILSIFTQSDFNVTKGYLPLITTIKNNEVRGMFTNIKEKALEKTNELALTRGEAPDAKGYGVRNTHLMAIAPNANSSIILGCSSSIEPRLSNCYTHKTRVGSYLVKNPALV